MYNRKFYNFALIITTSFLASHFSYSSDKGRKNLPEEEQKIIKDTEEKYEGVGKRTKKRSKGREIQKMGETMEKKLDETFKPLQKAGTAIGFAAAATGDPHAKMAAAGLKLSIMAIDELGKGIAKIIMGVGRYQERSQKILSNAEALLEEVQKSIDKKASLEKKLKELLAVEKSPEPSQSSSRLKQLGQGAMNLAKSAEIKVRQATDILTNDKASREEKLKAVQADLKEASENYNETIRLLQILLMQETLKEINKKINLEETIKILENDLKIYRNPDIAFSKNKTKRKKQETRIEKKEAEAEKEYLYYTQFQKSPTETPDELEADRKELYGKIKELTALTKRGDMIYLQEKEVELDSDVNRAAIVALYKENDEIRSQLKALQAQVTRGGPTPAESAKSQASQISPIKDTPHTTSKPAGSGTFSREDIEKKRQSLRPVTPPFAK